MEDRGFWRSIAGIIAPALTVGGVLLFALLRTYYSHFYGSLGVNPSDVGLGYASTLTTSAGLIVVTLAVAVLYPLVMISCLYGLLRVTRLKKSQFPTSVVALYKELRPDLVVVLRVMLPLTTLAALLLIGSLFMNRATQYSDAVMSGQAVKFGGLALSSFSIRATPVEVSGLSKADETSAFEALQRRSLQEPPLFYLGKVDGTLVIYDSTNQEVLYIPASSIMLKLSNCEARLSRDPSCKRAL
jgi:hypothetical protein